MREFGPRPASKHPDPAHWRGVRDAALARDTDCRLCGDDARLEVHHRTYARWGRERVEDVTVLCRACHDLITGAQMRRRDARRVPPPNGRGGAVPAERLPPRAAAVTLPDPRRSSSTAERTAWAQVGALPPPARGSGR